MQARAIWEQSLGPDHPDIAHSLHGLAELACKQGHYQKAGELCERVLGIRTQIFGVDHHEIARCFTLMAKLSLALEQYERAEALYTQALVILERSGLSQHPRAAKVLVGLAHLHQATGNDEEALTCAPRPGNAEASIGNAASRCGRDTGSSGATIPRARGPMPVGQLLGDSFMPDQTNCPTFDEKPGMDSSFSTS